VYRTSEFCAGARLDAHYEDPIVAALPRLITDQSSATVEANTSSHTAAPAIWVIASLANAHNP
jgi:hypothetical protein